MLREKGRTAPLPQARNGAREPPLSISRHPLAGFGPKARYEVCQWNPP